MSGSGTYFVCFIEVLYILSWRRQWQATPVLLPRKSHGWKSLVGYSPWGRHELVTTERLHFHFSLSRNGEGNGNPLQCSCLENSRDGRAWWAAVYGVAQSRTRLKRLSSTYSLCLRLDLQGSEILSCVCVSVCICVCLCVGRGEGSQPASHGGDPVAVGSRLPGKIHSRLLVSCFPGFS